MFHSRLSPFRRPTRTTVVVGISVLALALGGTAYGAIPNSTTAVISGCYQTFQGNLRVIDTQAGQRCNLLEKQLDWNQAGPTGPKGDTGPAGPQGPAGEPGSSAGDQVFYETGQAGAFPDGLFTLSKPVPVGSYVIRTEISISGSGSHGFINCTVGIAGSGPNRSLVLGTSGTASTVLTAALNNPGSFPLQLVCHNQTDNLISTEATLLATKVASVS